MGSYMSIIHHLNPKFRRHYTEVSGVRIGDKVSQSVLLPQFLFIPEGDTMEHNFRYVLER